MAEVEHPNIRRMLTACGWTQTQTGLPPSTMIVPIGQEIQRRFNEWADEYWDTLTEREQLIYRLIRMGEDVVDVDELLRLAQEAGIGVVYVSTKSLDLGPASAMLHDEMFYPKLVASGPPRERDYLKHDPTKNHRRRPRRR